MMDPEISKHFIHVPRRPRRTRLGQMMHAMKGVILGPPYCLFAALRPMPGRAFRAWCFALALRASFRLRRPVSLHTLFHLFFMPMESTRYFEFDFASRALAGRPVRRYLDVSSPRLLPMYLLATRSDVVADLVNPDQKDLDETGRFLDLIGAQERCQLHCRLITDAPLAPETFDLITSLSVLEHIPDDRAAVERIWRLLRPGGMLVLTVPCMAEAAEQYIDRNDWGVLEPDSQGHTFWQRFYDRRRLERNVYCITGRPRHMIVYGEKVAGSLARNSQRKRSDSRYPYWREPYMMATEYRYFDRPEELPGEGVIGLVFVK